MNPLCAQHHCWATCLVFATSHSIPSGKVWYQSINWTYCAEGQQLLDLGIPIPEPPQAGDEQEPPALIEQLIRRFPGFRSPDLHFCQRGHVGYGRSAVAGVPLASTLDYGTLSTVSPRPDSSRFHGKSRVFRGVVLVSAETHGRGRYAGRGTRIPDPLITNQLVAGSGG